MPQQVTEENWFFRLSRYAEPLREAIASGHLRIEPAGRRNEVLAFIDGGLEDFSVLRQEDQQVRGSGPFGRPGTGRAGRRVRRRRGALVAAPRGAAGG